LEILVRAAPLIAKHLDDMGALTKTVDLMHNIINLSYISINICSRGLDESLEGKTIMNN